MPRRTPQKPQQVPLDGPLLLIVDDSELIREFLKVTMEEELNAVVVEAEHGEEGLARIEEHDFDCVISDLDMPVMGGLEFVRAIRRKHSRMELPFLLLTATSGLSTKVDAFHAGASDYLIKDGNPRELLVRVETHVSLKRMHRELQKLAFTDALTGLGNRRWFTEQVATELSRAGRTGSRLSLLILDVDHFKNINDTYGHPAGDVVLAELAECIRLGARGYDVLARVGGEEFAVLLPETDSRAAVAVAERLRQTVEESAIGSMSPGTVTVSIGVCSGPNDPDESWSSLFKRSDRRLYIAKGSGRNRVCGPG